MSHQNSHLKKIKGRVFSLTWPASMQIYWNKRKRLHKKRVQLPKDWFGTPAWPVFHCFGTLIWPLWPHVKTLYSASGYAGGASNTNSKFIDVKTRSNNYKKPLCRRLWARWEIMQTLTPIANSTKNRCTEIWLYLIFYTCDLQFSCVGNCGTWRETEEINLGAAHACIKLNAPYDLCKRDLAVERQQMPQIPWIITNLLHSRRLENNNFILQVYLLI